MVLPRRSILKLFSVALRSPLAARWDQRGLNYTPFNHSDKYSLRNFVGGLAQRPIIIPARLYFAYRFMPRSSTVISRSICICVLYIGLMTRPLPEARTLDLFFRGGFALLRFYGIAHRRESERAGPVDPRYFAYQ